MENQKMTSTCPCGQVHKTLYGGAKAAHEKKFRLNLEVIGAPVATPPTSVISFSEPTPELPGPNVVSAPTTATSVAYDESRYAKECGKWLDTEVLRKFEAPPTEEQIEAGKKAKIAAAMISAKNGYALTPEQRRLLGYPVTAEEYATVGTKVKDSALQISVQNGSVIALHGKDGKLEYITREDYDERQRQNAQNHRFAKQSERKIETKDQSARGPQIPKAKKSFDRKDLESRNSNGWFEYLARK